MADKKIDPADKIKAQQEGERQFDEMKKLDISSLKVSDFKKIPKKRARFVHPFEGYPLKAPIDLGNGTMVSPSIIIALNPTAEPDQDPSGRRMSIVNMKTKKEEIKTLYNPHSRFISADGGLNSGNIDVVFDREMLIEGQPYHYAVVPSHEVRAQVCYFYDSRKERFEVDDRYLLIDVDQAANLMRLFQIMMRPSIRKERMAAMVAGDTDADEKTLMSLPSEA